MNGIIDKLLLFSSHYHKLLFMVCVRLKNKLFFEPGLIPRFLILVALISGAVIRAQGQDPLLVHTLSNALFLNPGFAGSLTDSKVSLNYRQQWPGKDTGFEDFFASYDQYSDFLHGGFGFYVMNDQAGKIMRNTSLAAIYSYQLQVSKSFFIQAGFQVAINQRSIDAAHLIFPEMIDAIRGIILPSNEMYGLNQKFYMDYSVGFIGYSKDWFTGISVHHLARPGLSQNESEETTLSRKLTLFGGWNFLLSANPKGALRITPELFFINQKDFRNILYGVELAKGPVGTAFHLRHDLRFSYTNLIFSLGFSHSVVSVAYSFEITAGSSAYSLPPGGAHEIGVTIRLNNTLKNNTSRAINLPLI